METTIVKTEYRLQRQIVRSRSQSRLFTCSIDRMRTKTSCKISLYQQLRHTTLASPVRHQSLALTCQIAARPGQSRPARRVRDRSLRCKAAEVSNQAETSLRYTRLPSITVLPLFRQFTYSFISSNAVRRLWSGRSDTLPTEWSLSGPSGHRKMFLIRRVDVAKSDFPDKISFGRAEDGRDFAIVVSKVEAGSAAEKDGLKKGQKLLAISSPMQSGSAGEMWPVNKRPSLRFVQDAVRMTRVSTITLELTKEAVLSTATISEDPKTSLMDSMEEAIEREGRPTVADKLAEAYKDDEDSAQKDKAQRDRRIQRRKDYMDRESTRDNSKFFIGLAASFFLPAAGILAYAFSSGMMDRIGNSYRPY